MKFSILQCDHCHKYDPCRYQWLNDDGLACVFCSQNCVRAYVGWYEAQKRYKAFLRGVYEDQALNRGA